MKSKFIPSLLSFVLLLTFFSSVVFGQADYYYSFTVNYGSYENIDFDNIPSLPNNYHYNDADPLNTTYGLVNKLGNRAIKYTPSGCHGTDVFIFEVKSGQTTKKVQVTGTITCYDPPIPECIYYVDYNCSTGKIIDADGISYDHINVNEAARTCHPTANYKGTMFLVNPTSGTVTFTGAGNQIDYSITDCNSYCGQTDSFIFLADKSGAGGDIPDPITLKVVIGFLCSDSNLIARTDTASVCLGECVEINVLTNDSYDSQSPAIINIYDQPLGSVISVTGNNWIRFCSNGLGPGMYYFTYRISQNNYQSNEAAVIVTVVDCNSIDEYERRPIIPASLLYPGVELQRFIIPTQPMPIDGSIAGIIDTGVTVMISGVEVPVLEISEGSSVILGQIRNIGFLTQIDAGIRFQNLPQGVTIEAYPQNQKIPAHATASYLLNINVAPETPKGEYLATVIAYARRGTLDRHLVKIIIN